ncbi:MAG: RHS repeat-associated core domain-containing protein, partial [Nocardiopsaceae bacterium]|nr:RHS repeat-associated core domain-containing protein [Nocardiopsaceae bacterium]
ALAEQAEHGPGPGRSRVTTWDYRPGTFTPLTQATRTTLRDAPQQVIDEQFHAIITDLTGTPSELVAPDGTLAGHQQRTLWGTTTWGADGASTPLRFPGQYHDPETGLHYNNQRYYDPHAGAYLTPDPLGLAASPNPHAYVPNPCAHIDPLGLEPGAAARQTEIEGLRAKLENLNAIKNRLVGGRSDGEAVLSGHGGIGPGDNTLTTVPDGTSVAMYSKHGESLSISHGNWIETGVNPISLEEVLPDPKKVYGPGDQLPNYILQPPSDLKVLGQPVTVTSPTRLSELLKPGMGRVHWAACRSIVPGIRGGLRHV